MSQGQRLDKFLWCARFAKSRSLAARLIQDGLVRLDGRAVKPSQTVQVGDRLTIRRGTRDHVVEIRALGQRRGPASEARLLYEEIAVATRHSEDWQPLIMDEGRAD